MVSKATVFMVMLVCLNKKGRATAEDVIQTDMVWAAEGESVIIDCSQTKGHTYFQMYWYRQRPAENMRLIVFTTPNSEPDFEVDFAKNKFNVTKPNAEKGTLSVGDLHPGDSGVYFCAVKEHSVMNAFNR
ncbi:unnamed protein product [Knipowitschia caucasica]